MNESCINRRRNSVPGSTFPASSATARSAVASGAHHAARVRVLPWANRSRCSTDTAASSSAHHRWTGAGDDQDRRTRRRAAPLDILLAQGLSGDRGLTLQKSVELGVAAIQPVATERSIVKLKDERAARRAEHWQNLVISACEQCGRNRVPPVAPLLGFGEWLGQLAQPRDELRLMLSPHAAVSLRELALARGRVILLAGPEGGLAPGEAQAAQSRGFTPVRLGPRVLRTETAALAALAAIQALWGDF